MIDHPLGGEDHHLQRSDGDELDRYHVAAQADARMKITDLQIHVLKSPLAEPFAFSQGWVRAALGDAGRGAHR